MIKKIILLSCLFWVFAVPMAAADAGGAPRPVDGKMIDIKIKALSDEISIGESATLEVTITNLTQYHITPVRMYFGISWFKIDHHGDLINIDTDDLTLGAYETVTFEITDEVADYIDWYRIGDEYYTDVEAEIDFTVRGFEVEASKREYNYQMAEDIITLKVNNLYDGSEYVQIEWIDDRQNAYCYEYFADDYYDDGAPEILDIAKVYYQMNVNNKSSQEVLGIAPYSQGVISDYFSHYYENEEIENSHTFRLAPIFYIEGQYYCVEKIRTYDIAIIEEPDVSIDISVTESENDDLRIKHTITIKNTGDEIIENYMIYTRKYYEEYGDLEYDMACNIEPGEKKTLECYFTSYYDLSFVYTGYLLEGMFYGWFKDVEVDEYETDKFAFEIFDDFYISVWDYNYEKSVDEAEENEIEETMIVTSTSTPIPTLTATPIIVETPTPSATAQVVVTKRQNPIIWLLVAVIILCIAALIMIIRIIIKQERGKVKND